MQDFFPSKCIYNRGIAGDTTIDLIKRIYNIIEIQPHKIFVQIGTNDLGKGVKPQKIVSNIKKIFSILKASIPGVEIISISLYPISHHKIWLSPIIAGLRTNKKINLTNELLKKLCKEMDITYINMHEELVGANDRIKKENTLEGLHISGIGYGVISKKIG